MTFTSFNLQMLALEMKEEMTNGWSKAEKETWNKYLEEEIAPYYPVLYRFLKVFTTEAETVP